MSEVAEVGTMENALKAYREAGNSLLVPKTHIAAWLVRNNLYDVPFEDKIKQCARDLGAAMKAASRTTADGRKVRKLLSARMPWINEDGDEVQEWLWDDAATCSGDFYHAAIGHMMKAVGKDIRSIHATAEWGNEHNPNLRENPIQLSFDFTDEVKQPEEDQQRPTQPR